MNKKNIIFLTILYGQNILIGMELPKKEIETINPPWILSKTFEDHRWISSVCVNPSEDLVAVVPCDSQIYIADIKSGEKMALLNFTHGITSLCFNPDSTKLVALSCKPETYIFDLIREKSKLTCIKSDSFAHKGAINSIYYNHNGDLLGVESTENDSKVSIINLQTHKKILSFNHFSWVIVSAVSQGEKFLATGSGNSKARLFNLNTKTELASFELKDSVSALAFDPFEKVLAIATRDNQVHLFDLETYTLITSLHHDKQILSMSFGSSGDVLVTGAFDSKIRIFTKKEKQL